MIIIINELSLNGQFGSVVEFVERVQEGLLVLEVLLDAKIEIYKNRDLYSARITPCLTLHDVLTKNWTEEIKLLRRQIYRITDKEPYWEDTQKHTCEAIYSSNYTAKTCNYGLAEAVENDQLVFSFVHPDFNAQILTVKKDTEVFQLINLTSIEGLRRWLTKAADDNRINLIDGLAESLLPIQVLTTKIIRYSKYDLLFHGLKHEDKIVIFEEFGEMVAILNGWKKAPKIAARNDRTAFQKKIHSKTYIFTIDTENGTFELHDRVTHLGEYNFHGEKIEEGIANRRLG